MAGSTGATDTTCCLYGPERAVSELDVLALEEIARHPYHQEFLALFGLRRLRMQSLAD